MLPAKYDSYDREAIERLMTAIPDGRLLEFRMWRDQTGFMAVEVELDWPDSPFAKRGLIVLDAWEANLPKALGVITDKIISLDKDRKELAAKIAEEIQEQETKEVTPDVQDLLNELAALKKATAVWTETNPNFAQYIEKLPKEEKF